MSVTIYEALINADFNIKNGSGLGLFLSMGQLHSVVTLLKKGYSLNDQVEPLLEKFGYLDAIPEKEKSNLDSETIIKRLIDTGNEMYNSVKDKSKEFDNWNFFIKELKGE